MKKGILPSAESRFFGGGGYPIRRSGDTSYRIMETIGLDPLHVKQMLSQLSYISMALIISDKREFGKLFFEKRKAMRKVHEKFIVKYWKDMIL